MHELPSSKFSLSESAEIFKNFFTRSNEFIINFTPDHVNKLQRHKTPPPRDNMASSRTCFLERTRISSSTCSDLQFDGRIKDAFSCPGIIARGQYPLPPHVRARVERARVVQSNDVSLRSVESGNQNCAADHREEFRVETRGQPQVMSKHFLAAASTPVRMYQIQIYTISQLQYLI